MPGGGIWSGIWGAVLLAAGLSGCEAVPLQLPFFTPTKSAQAEAPAATAPQPDAKTETPSDSLGQPKTAALPLKTVIDDNPARILGLGPSKLTEILGEPELTRREPPAEIWQYRGESCVFDVFLYEEAGVVRVTYLEARDEGAQRVAERNCLNQLLRARLAKPLS